MYFIFITALGTYFLLKKKLWDKKKLLKIYIWSIPLPVIACQLGWIAAEVGRQPWIVYKLLKTSEAASITVSAGEILFSIILFGVIYLLLFALFLFVLIKKIKHGPEPINPKEATI